MKKNFLLSTILIFTTQSGLLAAAAAPDENREYYNKLTSQEKTLVRDDLKNVMRVFLALQTVDEAERPGLIMLITDPRNPLVTDDLINAGGLIDTLGRVSKSEREALVGLVTNDETRLVTKNRSNAYLVISALIEVPAADRAEFVNLIKNPRFGLSDDLSNAFNIITTFRGIPNAKLRDLLYFVRPEEEEFMNDIMSNLWGIPAERRETFVDSIIRRYDYSFALPRHR